MTKSNAFLKFNNIIPFSKPFPILKVDISKSLFTKMFDKNEEVGILIG